MASEPLTGLGHELEGALASVRATAKAHGGRVAMVGILPTLPDEDLHRGAITGAGHLEPTAGHPAGRVGWWRHRGWLALDPTDALERRRQRIDRTKALTRGQLERLLARRDLPLRERTRWLLYETIARANERLAWTWRTWTWPTPGPGPQQGRRSRVGVLADRIGPAPPPPADRPDQRTGLPRCCRPAPGTPRCAPWSAMPAPDRRRSPATSPTPTRHAADPAPPAPHLEAGLK